MTNFNYQKDEGNKTSCRPRPPMLHPLLSDSSIKHLRKPPLYSLTTLLAYQEFEPENSHKRGHHLHEKPK